MSDSAHAQYVWSDTQGHGRNLVTLFRRRFVITQLPIDKAFLHIFADSNYRLRVNEVIIGYGPARFVPAFPEYDSYDLSAYLQSGVNVITVEVCHYGSNTFQTFPGTRAAFIAWGNIAEIDLATPGEWKARCSVAWNSQAPAFSFAQGPVEMLDLTRLPAGWTTPGFDDADWAGPTVLTDQQCWGTLTPRSLACNDNRLEARDGWQIEQLTAVQNYEDRLACTVAIPEFRQAPNRQRWFFCYVACLYSSLEQDIEAGLFWGPHYLNGEQVVGPDDPVRGNRKKIALHLQEGWNLLYGEIEMYADVWSFLLGLPHQAQLIIRSAPDEQLTAVFRYSEPLNESELQEKRQTIPTTFADVLAMPLKWLEVTRTEMPHLPALEMAWDLPAYTIPLSSSSITYPLILDCTIQHTYTIVLDWQNEYLGHIVLDIETPFGTIVDIAYDERKRSDGFLDLFKTNPFTNTVDSFTCSTGRQLIEGWRVRGGRYLQITIRVPQDSSEVIVHGIAFKSAMYPFQIEGSFTCSNDIFNWSWQASLKTMQACAEDVYMDCPWRERALYAGDVYNEARAQQAFSSDTHLIRRCLSLFAQGIREDGLTPATVPAWHRAPHGDFSLIWLLFLHDYWRWSGDLDLVQSLWSSVVTLWNSSQWQPENQEQYSDLWNASGLNLFIDWGVTNETRQLDENGVLNAFRYRALLCCAELADAMQLPEQSDQYRSQAQHLQRVFHERLWQPEKGYFVAGTQAGKLSETPPLHTNILALAFGLVNSEQESQVLHYVLERLAINRDYAFTHGSGSGYVELAFLTYTLDALYRYGQIRQAEELIQQHYSLLKDKGAWTLWECFERGYHDQGSLCHAWSCAPMIMAHQYILGVQKTQGSHSDTIIIAPCSETLTWAKGSVPHPRGLIHIEWKIEDNKLFVHVIVPEGLLCTIEPAGKLREYPLEYKLVPQS